MTVAKDWTYRQLAAEFIATALFVWMGCGVAISSNRWTEADDLFMGPAALVAIALSFGISISVLAYSIGHISGGHINPAVTLAFVLLRLQSVTSAILYIIAQCVGAIFGALVLWGCTASLTNHCEEMNEAGIQSQMSGVCQSSALPEGGWGPAFGLGVNEVNDRVSNGCAFFNELVGTYILVFTVLHAAVHTKSTAGNAVPIAIGWSILVVHLVLIPYTGCGINPARSLGPMVVNSMGGANKWVRGWWVYYTAPFVGSALATATYQFVLKKGAMLEEEPEEDVKDVAVTKPTEEAAVHVPHTYDEKDKNTGEEAETDDAVPHAYE